jgi:hypothetical protein
MRMVSSRLSLLSLLVLGCSAVSQPVHLATIDYFSSNEVVIGDEVKIYGDGFIHGDVDVVFDGQWKAGGQRLRKAAVVFKGSAAGENEIFFVMDRDAFGHLCASHIYFEGSVSVKMKTAGMSHTSTIDGKRDRVQFDILDLEPSGQRVCHETEERVAQFLEDVGLGVQEREEPGLAVTEVKENLKAHRAGLKAGDVLLVAGGVRVYTAEDLLPSPEDRSLCLVFSRAGKKNLMEATVPLRRFETSVNTKKNLLVALILIAVILFLQSPWMSRLVAVTLSLRPRFRRGRVPNLEPGAPAEEKEGEPQAAGGTGPAGEKLFDRLTALLFSLIVVFPFVTLLSFVLAKYGKAVHSAHACGVVFVLAFTAFIGESRNPTGMAAAFMRRMVTGFLVSLPLVLIFVLRWLKASSPMLEAAEGGQEFYPWSWNGMQEPFSFILLCCGLLTASVSERRRTPWRRHVVMHLYAITVIALIVHSMMGGFSPPRFLDAYSPEKAMAISVLIFMTKVLVIYFTLQALSCRAEGGQSPSVLNATLMALVAVTAFVASLLFAPGVIERVHNLHYYTTAAAFIVLVLFALLAGGAGKELRHV